MLASIFTRTAPGTNIFSFGFSTFFREEREELDLMTLVGCVSSCFENHLDNPFLLRLSFAPPCPRDSGTIFPFPNREHDPINSRLLYIINHGAAEEMCNTAVCSRWPACVYFASLFLIFICRTRVQAFSFVLRTRNMEAGVTAYEY